MKDDFVSDDDLQQFVEQGKQAERLTQLATALSAFYVKLTEGGMPPEYAFALTEQIAGAVIEMGEAE